MTRRQCLVRGIRAAAGLAAAAAPPLRAQAAAPSEIDWPAMTLLDGSRLEPASWQGQPSVVVFWATYCAFCKRHNAHLDKLFRSPAAASLRILGVALDTDAQAVRRYMAANDYRFPVALEAGRLRARLTSRRIIPMTCLIDRQGRLVQAIPGEMAEDDVLALAQLARPEKARAS
jgi:thiol-disulfide isomerase/thioredoxin